MSLQEIEQELNISYMHENMEEEEKAIEAISENPKYFYRCTKSKAQIKSSIGLVKISDGSEVLVTDNAEMCAKQTLNYHQATLTWTAKVLR